MKCRWPQGSSFSATSGSIPLSRSASSSRAGVLDLEREDQRAAAVRLAVLGQLVFEARRHEADPALRLTGRRREEDDPVELEADRHAEPLHIEVTHLGEAVGDDQGIGVLQLHGLAYGAKNGVET